MADIGARTRKVTTYGRKKTQIISVHTDFTPVKQRPKSPSISSSSDEEASPRPTKSRPPLAAKLSQDVLASHKNIEIISLIDEKDGKKPLSYAKNKNSIQVEKPKAKALKPIRASRKPARKETKEVPTVTVSQSSSREMLDCIELPPSKQSSVKKDVMSDLAVQLFGLDIDVSPSKKATTPDFLAPANPIQALLSACEHATIIPFDDLLSSQALKGILPGRARIIVKKIGEASYSEVYRLKRGKEEVVIKVIPLTSTGSGEKGEGDEEELPDCSNPEDVLREVQITKTMSDLRGGGFVNFKGVFMVEGSYPGILLDQWQAYKEECGTSSVNPEAFHSEQKYAVVMLEDGGSDLESYTFDKNVGWVQACGVFWQVVDALARAEEDSSFEHRDLHEGQILISPQTQLQGTDYSEPSTSGLHATIIDFGLSRLYSQDEKVIWSPLPTEVYDGVGEQWDVYRSIRDEVQGDWEGYHPITNVMWLRYVARYLIHSKDLRKPIAKVPARVPSSPLKTRRIPLTKRKEAVYDPISAKNTAAYEVLKAVEKVLTGTLKSERGGRMSSAGDVLQFGREKGWVL